MSTLTWQSSLLDADGVGPPGLAGFDGVRRRELAHGAWLEHVPAWVRASDAVFASCLEQLAWQRSHETIQGRRILTPRLTASLRVGAVPPALRLLDDVAHALGERYRVRFTRIGANLYRDGRDSVAWHGDRVLRDRRTALVATVSLGHPRTFRLKPAQGGASLGLPLGRGDLLVMGGTCQRTWRHAVPKVAAAGPRISLAFRHDDPPGRLPR